jgi:hypothetical protein
VYILLLLTTLAAATPQVEVETLDGRTLIGSLVQLDPQRLTMETPQEQVSLPTDELLQITFKESLVPPDVTPRAWVETADGSSLVGVEFTVEGKTARLQLSDGSVVETPTAALTTVRLAEQSEETAAEWSRIAGMRHTTDVLVIRSGDVLDYHRGVLRDVSADTLRFELDGELLPVGRSKVYGLVYYHPPGDASPEPICQIIDVGGSRWSVKTFELGRELGWTTPGGLERAQPPSAIRKIDFSRGRIIFLSDLEPESVGFTPFFGAGEASPLLAEFYALGKDRNLQAGPLQLDSKQYRKGLAMHSRTEVVYRLPGRFRRFQAVVGIDDAVRPRGNVRLVISGDQRVLLETTVSGADPPQPVELDLGGVRRLSILADFGQQMDLSDHLDLCEARIIK